MMAIGSHQSANMLNDEWLTPPEIIRELGPFNLDPCAPVKRPWEMASYHYTELDMGLMKPWFGRVWLNPPYGSQTGKWLKKLCDHGNGIALIFARTETEMFFSWVWKKADAVLFIKGRLFFHYVDGTKAKGNSGAPSVLVAYGENNASALQKSGIKGAFINIKSFVTCLSILYLAIGNHFNRLSF
jgi:hypothetical protein